MWGQSVWLSITTPLWGYQCISPLHKTRQAAQCNLCLINFRIIDPFCESYHWHQSVLSLKWSRRLNVIPCTVGCVIKHIWSIFWCCGPKGLHRHLSVSGLHLAKWQQLDSEQVPPTFGSYKYFTAFNGNVFLSGLCTVATRPGSPFEWAAAVKLTGLFNVRWRVGVRRTVQKPPCCFLHHLWKVICFAWVRTDGWCNC